MNIKVTLRHGPLDFEIEADSDDDDYQDEIAKILDFVEENKDKLNDVGAGLAPTPRPSGGTDVERAPSEETETETSSESSEAPDTESNGRFVEISRRVGVDEATLERMFDVPEDKDEIPAIIIEEFNGGVDSLGDNRMERQARGSLMLLYMWQKVHDLEKVYSSDLADALHMSGVDPEKTANMYQAFDGDADAYFERHGSGGPYSGVSLTRRGERVAINEIEKFSNNMKSN